MQICIGTVIIIITIIIILLHDSFIDEEAGIGIPA